MWFFLVVLFILLFFTGACQITSSISYCADSLRAHACQSQTQSRFAWFVLLQCYLLFRLYFFSSYFRFLSNSGGAEAQLAATEARAQQAAIEDAQKRLRETELATAALGDELSMVAQRPRFSHVPDSRYQWLDADDAMLLARVEESLESQPPIPVIQAPTASAVALPTRQLNWTYIADALNACVPSQSHALGRDRTPQECHERYYWLLQVRDDERAAKRARLDGNRDARSTLAAEAPRPFFPPLATDTLIKQLTHAVKVITVQRQKCKDVLRASLPAVEGGTDPVNKTVMNVSHASHKKALTAGLTRLQTNLMANGLKPPMIVELRNKILESSEIDPKAPVRTIVEPFKTSLDIGSAVGAGVSGNAGRIPLANSSQMPLQSSSLDAGDGKKKDSKSHRAGGSGTFFFSLFFFQLQNRIHVLVSGSNTATGGVKSSKAASQKKKAADASLEEISLAPPDDLAVGSEGGSVKKAKGSGAGSSKKAPKSPTNKASSPKSAKEHVRIDLGFLMSVVGFVSSIVFFRQLTSLCRHPMRPDQLLLHLLLRR
jgi:hypothetical protein